MVLFPELSDNLCRRYMRSTECPYSFRVSVHFLQTTAQTVIRAWNGRKSSPLQSEHAATRTYAGVRSVISTDSQITRKRQIQSFSAGAQSTIRSLRGNGLADYVTSWVIMSNSCWERYASGRELLLLLRRDGLWCCHHGRAIARVHPVHLMNVERRQSGRRPSDQARLRPWVCL